MPKAVLARRGKEHLSGIQLSELEEMYRHEPPGKSRDRLQAAVLRKRGKMIVEMVTMSGRHPNTIHRWLNRLERKGLEGRHDWRDPGRPRLLTLEQERLIKEDLDGPPSESGFGRGSWNAKMLARRIGDRFGIIPCSRRTALRIAGRLGFSTCKPWFIPYNSATPKEQAAFIEKMKETIARWKEEGRTLLAVDAVTLRDSPTSSRGLRRRGGKNIVRTNHSKKSNHLIGALGDGALDLPFHDNLKADGHAALVEYARRRHKKVGIIADNTGALAGKTMSDYIADTDGTVEMVHIPPHTPQTSRGFQHGRDGRHNETEKRLAQR